MFYISELLKETIEKYIDDNDVSVDYIVSGGAKGADCLGEKFAKDDGFETKIFKPNWDKFGAKAGPLRNTTIVENSDVIFAFWDEKSRGTNDSITKAKNLKKELIIIKY